MVIIIDYHVGNLKSVLNGCRRAGIEAQISSDKETIKNAKALILPGVGTFKAAMEHLKETDLIDTIRECYEKGTPILGICLGMQILFEEGNEVTPTKGLGFLSGKVAPIECSLKIPHMGWNELYFENDHPLLKYLSEKEDVYFVHSFQAYCPTCEVVAYARYKEAYIPAIVAKNNVMGCQFHPEKSGETGKKILKAFKEMIAC